MPPVTMEAYPCWPVNRALGLIDLLHTMVAVKVPLGGAPPCVVGMGITLTAESDMFFWR